MFTALPSPRSKELILDGVAKQFYSETMGNYTLVQELINGYPYWVQQNGDNAIWFGSTSYPSWVVGPETFLGSTTGFIWGPYGVDFWPTQIIDGYDYWDGSSIQYFASSDLILKDSKR